MLFILSTSSDIGLTITLEVTVMKEFDQSIYPSYKVCMNAEAITLKSSLPAILTEISAKGIAIQSKKAIPPNSQIVITLKLSDEVVLRGYVSWVLDLHSLDRGHYFQTGIRTDTILHSNMKAVGMAEKSRLLQDILYEITAKCLN